MDRVSAPNFVTVGGKRYFRNKNQLAGIIGTTEDEVFLSGVQECIVGVEEAAGLVPADASSTGSPAPDPQLYQAIARLAASSVTSVTGSTVLTADSAGLILVSAAAGNLTITLPASAAANGKPLSFKFLRTDTTTNSASVALHAGDTMLRGGASGPLPLAPARVLELLGDGVSHWIAMPAAVYGWDASNAPAADVPLQPGDRAILTFAAASTVPLKIATSPGIYLLKVALTANNTTNSDIDLKPNNTTFSNAFSNWSMRPGDVALTGFGSASAIETFTALTGSPFISSLAQVVAQFNSAANFHLDQVNGPTGSDTLNDIGPSMQEWMISTVTNAKMVRAQSGIAGGAGVHFGKWSDTTTAWTSLGTYSDLAATSLTGTIAIERVL